MIDNYDVGAELTGVAPMFYITFKKDETGAHKGKRTDFYTQLIRRDSFSHPIIMPISAFGTLKKTWN